MSGEDDSGAGPDVTVTENPGMKRFEARLDGELAAIVEYIPLPGKIIATHTQTLARYEGQGVGSQLVQGMLDQLRADGRLLQPQCPYVAAYLRKHAEYQDVVDTATPH